MWPKSNSMSNLCSCIFMCSLVCVLVKRWKLIRSISGFEEVSYRIPAVSSLRVQGSAGDERYTEGVLYWSTQHDAAMPCVCRCPQLSSKPSDASTLVEHFTVWVLGWKYNNCAMSTVTYYMLGWPMAMACSALMLWRGIWKSSDSEVSRLGII